MTKRVIVTLRMWEDFESTRQSGVMNMWGHHFARIFCNDVRYARAFKHFETDGLIGDLEVWV